MDTQLDIYDVLELIDREQLDDCPDYSDTALCQAESQCMQDGLTSAVWDAA
jgi:hypothetical protein